MEPQVAEVTLNAELVWVVFLLANAHQLDFCLWFLLWIFENLLLLWFLYFGNLGCFWFCHVNSVKGVLLLLGKLVLEGHELLRIVEELCVLQAKVLVRVDLCLVWDDGQVGNLVLGLCRLWIAMVRVEWVEERLSLGLYVGVGALIGVRGVHERVGLLPEKLRAVLRALLRRVLVRVRVVLGRVVVVRILHIHGLLLRVLVVLRRMDVALVARKRGRLDRRVERRRVLEGLATRVVCGRRLLALEMAGLHFVRPRLSHRNGQFEQIIRDKRRGADARRQGFLEVALCR